MLLCVQTFRVFAICLEFYGVGKTDGNFFVRAIQMIATLLDAL